MPSVAAGADCRVPLKISERKHRGGMALLDSPGKPPKVTIGRKPVTVKLEHAASPYAALATLKTLPRLLAELCTMFPVHCC